jgi:hypothetical protein
MSDAPKLLVDRWGYVRTFGAENFPVVGFSLCQDVAGPYRDEAQVNTARLIGCFNACAGLSPEQVAAIPRLIAWYTNPVMGLEVTDEFNALEKLFPPREFE